MAGNTTDIVLGSGKLYGMPISEFTGAFDFDELIAEVNILGLIKGGAEISYKPTIKELKDDLNIIRKKFITAETATLKSGIMTWDVEALHGLLDSAYSETAATTEAVGVKQLKLGGVTREIAQYALAFVHQLTPTEQIRVGIVGTNDTGLTLKMTVDTETTVDAEFTATGIDDKGVLVIIEQDTPKLPATP